MSSDKIQKLHSTLASATYQKKHYDPRVEKMLDGHHLALFINGDWLAILPGMILGLMTNRQHVNGIAPYIVKKVGWKPGKEFIDLVAWSSDGRSTRTLRFGVKYSGRYVSGINSADEAIDGAVNAKRLAAEEE